VGFKRKENKRKEKRKSPPPLDGTFLPWMNIISLVTSGVHLWNGSGWVGFHKAEHGKPSSH
jgi:hypothetical protein